MQRSYSYDTSLVLRTVYLPRDLDERLREIAFSQRTSKNEVIRSLLQEALKTRKHEEKVPARAASTG